MIFDFGKAILEGLLFASPEPLSLRRLAELMGMEEKAVRSLLEELRQDYQAPARGLTLIEVAGGYQLATRPDLQEYVARLLPERQQPVLSRAALETLAVVAYNQPVTRAEVEHVRGVASDRSLNTLVERGLIQETGRKDAPGRPILYATSSLFLQHFGLSSLTELPRLEDFPVSLESLEAAAEAMATAKTPSGEAEPAPDRGSLGEGTEKEER